MNTLDRFCAALPTPVAVALFVAVCAEFGWILARWFTE